MDLINKIKKKEEENLFHLMHIYLWLVNMVLCKMASRWSVKSFVVVKCGQYGGHPCTWVQGYS